MATQIQKQQFENQTDGWIGAVVIGPRGDEKGIPVEPGGTVWLSEPEQHLTANAPRNPKDNPFIEQEFTVQDPVSGENKQITVTPLVPVSEDRYVPASERFVPASAPAAEAAAAAAAATGPEPQTAVLDQGSVERRSAEVTEDTKPNQPPPPPARAAAAVQAAQEPQEPPVTPPATQTPSPEEHAAKTDPRVGEETGAATPPSGAPPAGEFAAREEVGTPVPTSPDETAEQGQAGPPPPPAPWSPGSTEG